MLLVKQLTGIVQYGTIKFTGLTEPQNKMPAVGSNVKKNKNFGGFCKHNSVM